MDEFKAANIEIHRFCNLSMKHKHGLPIRPSEMGVLNIIVKTAGPHTPLQIAECLSVSKPMVTALISSLMEKEYITKQQSPEDKRSCFVIPTQKAESLVAIAEEEFNRTMLLLTEKMGENDFNRLVELLGLANRILKEEGKNR